MPLFFFCYGDEENGHRACTNEHLTTANQSVIRKAYHVSVPFVGSGFRTFRSRNSYLKAKIPYKTYKNIIKTKKKYCEALLQ